MFNRATQERVPGTATDSFPAPSQGWVQSGNIVAAPKDQAEVLDNFIPTAQGIRLRGGSTTYLNVGSPIVRLFTYESTTTSFFGSTATELFDVDRYNADQELVTVGGETVTVGGEPVYLNTVTFYEVDRLSSGDWSTTQISTSGGEFLVAVNGTDYAHYFNGSVWNPIADVAINDVGFDAQTGNFSVGETVTGGSSGASATIYSVTKTTDTEGILKVGTITSGPFTDNEALTDGDTGAATADGASASASAITISGIATTSLSQVWLFKERLFFVEKQSQSAWYLPVESIGGTATEINLGSVFRRGGTLLFGATWSLDSGDGLDDVCLFVSDLGEIAVYEGTDPSSASTWALVGVYDVGKPLNKHAFFKAGGDLAILTEDGIIPVSEALKKDRAALQAVAITYPIEDAWKEAISNRTVSYPINATLWQSQTLLVIGTPAKANNLPVSFIANARTGAWSRVTGWDVRCSTVVGDKLYFGTNDGLIMQADTTGADNGQSFTAYWVPKFGYSDEFRAVNAVGITYKANAELDFTLFANSDYEVEEIMAPASTSAPSGTTWGTGVWGTFVWGSGGQASTRTFNQWQATGITGYTLAPGVAITSNQDSKLTFEPVTLRMRAEAGYAL